MAKNKEIENKEMENKEIEINRMENQAAENQAPESNGEKEMASHEREFKKAEKTMKDILAKEKKVTIFIPENPINPNEVVPVSLNGVTYAIPVGQDFVVPESIYNVWKYSYEETRKANAKMAQVLNKEIKIY